MRSFSLIAALVATASTLSLTRPDQAILVSDAATEQYLIELGPGNTRWVTEDEKWVLRRVRYFDAAFVVSEPKERLRY